MLQRAFRILSIVGSSFIRGSSEEFEWCNQQRDVQAKHRVHAPNVSELVCIRQMITVPGQKKIALVKRGVRERQSITVIFAWVLAFREFIQHRNYS